LHTHINNQEWNPCLTEVSPFWQIGKLITRLLLAWFWAVGFLLVEGFVALLTLLIGEDEEKVQPRSVDSHHFLKLQHRSLVQSLQGEDQVFFSYCLSVDEKFQGWVCVREGEEGLETFICVDLEAVYTIWWFFSGLRCERYSHSVSDDEGRIHHLRSFCTPLVVLLALVQSLRCNYEHCSLCNS
jgi:hypothetical protein